MKDQVFTGRTVVEAVGLAARTLGLAPDALRYVILEREAPGVLGMGGTPARIAVLLESRATGGGGAPASSSPVETERRGPGRSDKVSKAQDPRAAIRGFIRELGETGELDLTAEVEETDDRTVVRLFGSGRDILLERGAEGLVALDHILQRAFAHDVQSRRLVLECEGFREARDGALGARAKALAEEVLADGRSRETEPLNSYERRIVHVALADMPGVRTFSVGEGADRRVTVARRSPDDPAAGQGNDGGREG
jgi:spoIIIJ-associated protein